MADLYVCWDEYRRATETLARAVGRSGWRFDQIVCIARGGLRVGDTLSRIFDIPLAIISTQSYGGEGGTVRGHIRVAEHLTMTTARLGSNILLVDDLVDSGITLDVVKRHLEAHFSTTEGVRTAVLWYKAVSIVKPDYFVHYLPENPWIHQPFEHYDLMDAAESLER
ncbi:MAG: phosphoribosyltransferase [Proteobacteria bacterium]|nr:phosphoribosyltransferase [Burkholderiales bacterium]